MDPWPSSDGTKYTRPSVSAPGLGSASTTLFLVRSSDDMRASFESILDSAASSLPDVSSSLEERSAMPVSVSDSLSRMS